MKIMGKRCFNMRKGNGSYTHHGLAASYKDTITARDEPALIADGFERLHESLLCERQPKGCGTLNFGDAVINLCSRATLRAT